ncbi:MAG: hypothetical protein QXO47_10865 [Thermoproteota archaeon]
MAVRKTEGKGGQTKRTRVAVRAVRKDGRLEEKFKVAKVLDEFARSLLDRGWMTGRELDSVECPSVIDRMGDYGFFTVFENDEFNLILVVDWEEENRKIRASGYNVFEGEDFKVLV